MQDDLCGDDPKAIWQNQTIEESTMTLEKIRKKARQVHTKTRRELLRSLAVPIAVGFFYAFGIREFPALQQVLHPLFAFALVWSLAGLYFLIRGKWSAEMPGDTGFSAGIEFCRREIERRRDYFRRVLVWGFGPLLLAIGTIVLALAAVGGRELLQKGIPFLTLVVVWITGYFVIRVRQDRQLQCEIKELDDIERENRR
jgi:hypothetical protein